MNIKNKSILITGGAGFIGSHLVERLVNDNYVVVFDNMKRNALKHVLESHPNLHIVKGDVLDVDHLGICFKNERCNIIIHLAAIAGIYTVTESPSTTMKVNIIGTQNILDLALTMKGLERFVNFSTSEVYGTFAYKNKENDPTYAGVIGEARPVYGASKIAGEHLAYSCYTEHQLPIVNLRPFNVYGPRQIGEGAIHNFITLALQDKEIIVYGDGTQIRSWCYIDDMVNGVFFCLEKDKSVGEVFNIGTPRGTIGVYELAKKIIKITNSKSEIVFLKRKVASDIEIRIPNIAKAQKFLGYNPAVELDEGLERTVAWFRKNYSKL